MENDPAPDRKHSARQTQLTTHFLFCAMAKLRGYMCGMVIYRPYNAYIYIYTYPYGSKHCLRRYLTLQIIPQTLPKKVLGSIGYIYILHIIIYIPV